jgi:hypothetical protein
MTSFSALTGPQIHTKNVYLNTGIGYALYISPGANASGPDIPTSGGTREYAYQGIGRNIGAALIYYAAEAHTHWRTPSAMAEVEARPNDAWSILAGYQITPYDLVLNSGWDRYSAFQKYQDYTVSTNHLHEVYTGIGIHDCDGGGSCVGGHFLLGYVMQRVDPTPLGREMIVEYAQHLWKVQAQLSVHW